MREGSRKQEWKEFDSVDRISVRTLDVLNSTINNSVNHGLFII